MTELKDELIRELETARRDFHHLLDSVPPEFFSHPSDNPAWTIGDVLYHITLGPPAIRMEAWMTCNMKWLFKLFLSDGTSRIFNKVNAVFTGRPKRVTPEGLRKAYDRGHLELVASLNLMREKDLAKSMTYPESFVSEIAGTVSVERLFRYARQHVDIHTAQINDALKMKGQV